MTWRPVLWWSGVVVVSIAAPTWYEVIVVGALGWALRPKEK